MGVRPTGGSRPGRGPLYDQGLLSGRTASVRRLHPAEPPHELLGVRRVPRPRLDGYAHEQLALRSLYLGHSNRRQTGQLQGLPGVGGVRPDPCVYAWIGALLGRPFRRLSTRPEPPGDWPLFHGERTVAPRRLRGDGSRVRAARNGAVPVDGHRTGCGVPLPIGSGCLLAGRQLPFPDRPPGGQQRYLW